MSEAVDLLTAIAASLREIAGLLKAAIPPPVAKASDLDGKYGDPVLKFLPRDWSGEDWRQRHYSECPAGLLDLVAEANDYFARKADEGGEKTEKGQPVSKFKSADAARARGWAARLRAGWTPSGPPPAPAQAPPAGLWAEPAVQPDEEDVPF